MPPSRPGLQAPHPPLEAYYPHEEGRRAWALSLFGQTAADYDRIEWLMGLGT